MSWPEVITARHMGLSVVGLARVNSLCGVHEGTSEKESTLSVINTLLKAIASFT